MRSIDNNKVVKKQTLKKFSTSIFLFKIKVSIKIKSRKNLNKKIDLIKFGQPIISILKKEVMIIVKKNNNNDIFAKLNLILIFSINK